MLSLTAGRASINAAAAISLLALATTVSAQMPQPADMAAKVMKLTGQVSVLHDSQPWALNVGDAVQVRQVIVTGPDGYAQFQVSDGSTFEVYPNSSVIFRKNPPNWRDLLDVFVGRVKIHIQKWGDQPNPNRIHTPTAVISVRGTTFEVSVDHDDTTVISVEEGWVDVRHALKGGETKTLKAGETLSVYRTQPLATRLIDKGAVAQRVIRALADALYTAGTNTTGGPTGTSTGAGGGTSGNTTRPAPPAPPPPTTPPPPPH